MKLLGLIHVKFHRDSLLWKSVLHRCFDLHVHCSRTPGCSAVELFPIVSSCFLSRSSLWSQMILLENGVFMTTHISSINISWFYFACVFCFLGLSPFVLIHSHPGLSEEGSLYGWWNSWGSHFLTLVWKFVASWWAVYCCLEHWFLGSVPKYQEKTQISPKAQH